MLARSLTLSLRLRDSTKKVANEELHDAASKRRALRRAMLGRDATLSQPFAVASRSGDATPDELAIAL
jgi:hypothetical protein